MPNNRIKIDLTDITKLLKLDGKAQTFLTNTVAKHMDKYIPMDKGNLRTNVSLTQNTITYESPYAHAQYVGFTTGPVVKYTTPGTGPYWDKRMLSDDKITIQQELTNYMLSRR